MQSFLNLDRIYMHFTTFYSVVLVIDPQIAGISGDMILCSLVDLGADKNKIISGIKLSEKFLPNSKINKIDFEKTKKHGIEATSLILEIDEGIHERKGIEIKNAISNAAKEIGLPDNVKSFTESCIDSLISAEAKIHSESIDSVHFHEASSIDTLIDIIGSAIALDDLGLFDDEILALPVAVGGGSVSFSHGTVSNPANAILEIFKDSAIVIHGGGVKDELTTPTGACILVNLASKVHDYYPAMQIQSVGYGAGKKNFDDFANVLKMVRGIPKNSFEYDSIKILETNVDDVSGEILGNLIDKIMDRGAKDVSIYSGITKKSRPANLISIICDDEKMDEIIDILISETGTLGIRISTCDRIKVPRKIQTTTVVVQGKEFSISYKRSDFKGKTNFKIEFEDLKKVSNSLHKSIKETEMLIREAIVNH